ncbi:MAG: hypothetical protein PVS3B3_39450 [Ktedonobacteraceae bacterium]
MTQTPKTPVWHHRPATGLPGRHVPPTRWSLFIAWSAIGIQSFGGGSSTLLLIRRAFVERHQWIEVQEYERIWSLSQLTPGIKLIAVIILMGRRLGGWWGVVISLLGMLLPSATITCLLTVGFTTIQHLLITQAVLHGVVPATAGIMLTLALQFAFPLLKRGQREGFLNLGATVVLIVGCTTVLFMSRIEVLVIVLSTALISAGVFTALYNRVLRRQSIREEN